MAARDRGLEPLAGGRIAPHDGPRLGPALIDRHLHDMAGPRMERQEGRVGLPPLRAERGQHDRHDGVVALEHGEQRRVEAAGPIALGRRQEFVIESEGVEERAQTCVVVVAEAFVRTERVRHLGQRLVQRVGEQIPVRHVVGNLAQAVHVVRESDEPRRDGIPGENPKGMAHHRRAGDLAEGPDMRQSRGTVPGLEHGLVLARPLEPHHQLARLFERPGIRALGSIGERRIEGERLVHGSKAGFPGSAAH
jgi:hypothetical protein